MAKKLFLCVGLAVGATLWLAAASLAAEAAGPCADDVAKFCKDVNPGGGRLAKCLKEHEKELSDSCKKRQEQMVAHAKAVGEMCSDDVEKFCADVKPGGGRVVKCLGEHKDELSAECKEGLTKKGGKKGKGKAAE